MHARIAAHVQARDIEETHRLLYVALTRAEDHLVLSWCGSGSREWAGVVNRQLDIDRVEEKDTPQIVQCTSPYEQSFAVRVLRATRIPDRSVHYSDALPSDPESLAPPELTDQHDSTASVTSLTQFAVCPRKYYLSRYLGLEASRRAFPASAFDEDEDEDVEPRLDAGELGTQVHQLLAGLPIAGGADLRAMALAQTFDASPLSKRAKKARRVEREYEFLLAINDVIVSGTIDLWFQDAREIIIVDYKTDDVSAAEAVQRARDYTTQLRLYALALERETGHRPSHAYLHFLRPDVVIDCDLRGDLEAEAQQAVTALSAAQASGNFPLHEAAHCYRCQFFRGPCPAGTRKPAEGHVQTLAVLI